MFGQSLPFLRSLSFHLVKVLLCLAAGGNAQDPSTVEWTIGRNLRFFITTNQDIETCPLTLQNANSDSSQVLPIFSSTAVTAGGSLTDPTGSTSFRLTNGWLKQSPFDASSQTTIQVAEPNAVGGGCWFSESNGNIVVAPCGTDRCFQFYMVIRDAGPYDLWDCNLHVITSQGTAGGPLAVNRDANWPNICIYDVLTGLPVVAPATKYHFPMSQITNLTGTSIAPPTAPAAEADLPVCNSDGIDQLGTIDCAIAKAVNGLPANCDKKPDSPECILHLAPSFCSDLPSVRMGFGSSNEEVERCLQAVSQGPCVANPGGAACASGLFPGISFVGGGGGSPGKRDVKSFLGGAGSFFIGIFKSLINSGLVLVESILGDDSDTNKVVCMALSYMKSNVPDNVAAAIRDGCQFFLFKRHGIIRPLDYDNNVERAGGIVADIAQLVIPLADLAKEAQLASFLDGVLAKFTAKSAKEILAEGEFLEAAVVGEEGSVVRIFKDKGDGTPAGLFGSGDTESLVESTRKTGFQNCIKAASSTRRARRAPPKLEVVCEMVPVVVEKPYSELSGESSETHWEPSIPVSARTVNDLFEAPGITDAEKTLLNKLGGDFTAFYTTLTPTAVAADDITMAFYNARQGSVRRTLIMKTAYNTYGLKADELMAMRRWSKLYEIDTARLRSGLTQLDGTVAPVTRLTKLDPDHIIMLDTAGPGIQSKGPPGVYEVRDLCRNKISIDTAPDAATVPSKIMASSLDAPPETFVSSADYMFVIQSKTGRYITPIIGGGEEEVVFMQDIAGQFKLLGRHELNGGAAAKAAGKPGPYAVYYFEEFNPPKLSPRICGSATSSCRAEILTAPKFP